jgi:hypothetical protein
MIGRACTLDERDESEAAMVDRTEMNSPAGGSPIKNSESRRGKRYEVPRDCQQHVKLWVKNSNERVPAILGNFSRHGILFECPVPFKQGDHTEGIISISLLLSREITFGIEVKYCYEDHGSHITGASIDAISDEFWFDAFTEVYDLIVLRKGSK